MRLAIFTNKFPSNINTFFARDIRNLIESGIEVDIFPLYPLDPELWNCIPEILNERMFPRSQVHHIGIGESLFSRGDIPFSRFFTFIKDVMLVLLSASRYGLIPLAKSAYAAIKAWGWVCQNKQKYDHILSYWGNYSATSAYLFHRLVGDGSGFSLFLHAGTDLYRTQVFLEQKLLYADNIFVVCKFNREFLQKLYPATFPKLSDKIHLYYLGLDFSELPYSPDNRLENSIVAVGGLTKVKGFEYLLYATQELISRGLVVNVNLIGDGEERNALAALTRKLGIADKVHFSGWMPFEEVKSAMLQATLLVHPSSELGDLTTTVIKEALLLGTPVVATRIAGIPEVLDYGRCGELALPKDVKALADAIEKLLQNESLRKNYAAVGRKFSEEKFDLWKNGRELADTLSATKRQRNLTTTE